MMKVSSLQFTVSGFLPRLPLVFFLVLAYTSLSFAQQNQVCDGDFYGQALGYAAIGFAGLTGLLAISYIAGEALHNPRLSAWPKDEISQMLFSAISIALIFQILSLFCSITVFNSLDLAWIGSQVPEETQHELERVGGGGLQLDEQDNVFQASQKFLIYLELYSYSSFSNIRAQMGNYEKQITLNTWNCKSDGQLIGFCGLGGGGVSKSPNAGKQAYISFLGLFMNSSMVSLLTALAQVSIWQFLFAGSDYTNSFLIFCLVGGLLLRSIPFMRPFGGALIGIGISLYIFFPLLLSIESVVFPAVADTTGLFYRPEGDQGLVATAAVAFFGTFTLSAINLILVVTSISQVSGLLGQEVDASRLARLI